MLQVLDNPFNILILDGSIDVASRSTGGTSINMSVQQLYTLRRSLGLDTAIVSNLGNSLSSAFTILHFRQAEMLQSLRKLRCLINRIFPSQAMAQFGVTF